MASNAALHREMDQALNDNDLETARQLMDVGVVTHFSGDNPLAGDFHGRDAFFEAFGRVAELTGGTLSIQHTDILESEERSIAISKVSATREGQAYAGDTVDICRWSDGKLVEEWVIPFDQRAWDEFWA